MKLSEIYGKEIESADGTKRGTIYAVSWLNGAVDGYAFFDGGEREFFAPADKVSFSGGKARYCGLGKENKNASKLRLGVPVYSEDGKFLGSLKDCTLRGATLTAAHFGGRRCPADRLSFGDAVIVKGAVPCAETHAKDMFISAVCN